jgi:kynureninase
VSSWRKRPHVGYEYMDLYEKWHRKVERLINAPHDTVFQAPSLTVAQILIASTLHKSVDRRNKHEILEDDRNFPSANYVWSCISSENNHNNFVVTGNIYTSRYHAIIPDFIEKRTAAVVVPYVSPITGDLLDIPALAERCAQTGTLLVVDAYHAVGIIPVDVQKLGEGGAPLVLLGGLSKWVGAPSWGGCFGYVSPAAQELLGTPMWQGYLGHEKTFDWKSEWQPGPGARRFATGMIAIEPLAGAIPQLEWIERVGIHNIRERSMRLTSTLQQEALKAGLCVATDSDPEKRGGMVVLKKIPSPERIESSLLKSGIVVDTGVDKEKDCLRLGPHPCMTEYECVVVISLIRERITQIEVELL